MSVDPKEMVKKLKAIDAELEGTPWDLARRAVKEAIAELEPTWECDHEWSYPDASGVSVCQLCPATKSTGGK
jgi:hypothetical protein